MCACSSHPCAGPSAHAVPQPLCLFVHPCCRLAAALSSASCPPCTWDFTQNGHSDLLCIPPLDTGASNCLGIAVSFPKLGRENFQLLPVCTQKCFLCCATSSWPRSCAPLMLLAEAGEAGGFCWDPGVPHGATLFQESRSLWPALLVLRTCLLPPSIQ